MPVDKDDGSHTLLPLERAPMGADVRAEVLTKAEIVPECRFRVPGLGMLRFVKHQMWVR
jgi:hypothetical protein